MTTTSPPTEWQHTLLHATLQLTVPLRIAELRAAPLDQLLALGQKAADTVAEHGDDLQYGGAHCARARAALTTGLAVAALAAWGGVTWRSLHWCRNPACHDPGDVDGHPQPYPGAVKPPASPRRPVEALPDIAAWLPPAA